MIRCLKFFIGISILLLIAQGCGKKDYSMGELTAPTDVVINTSIVGQDATHPNGDGSGDVVITLTGKNVLAWKINYDANNSTNFENLATGKTTKKYTKIGVNTYRLSVIAYGPGATPTTITKDIIVRSDFTPAASIVNNLVGNGSKTWRVDKSIPAHFGVGPWSSTSITPEWWSAAINEKVSCCNCFYTASYTFSKDATTGNYSLAVATPDGAFTKTGSLAGGLPGIPGSGPEACYSYGGGSSSFS